MARYESLKNCSLQNSVFVSRAFQPQPKAVWTWGRGEQAVESKLPLTGGSWPWRAPLGISWCDLLLRAGPPAVGYLGLCPFGF